MKLKYRKAVKDKIRKCVVALFVMKFRNDPTKLRDEKIDVIKFYIRNDIVNNVDNNSRKCDICYISTLRTSDAKHLRSNKHIEKIKIILEWLFPDSTGFNPAKK